MPVTSITDYVLFGTASDTKPTTGIASQTLYFEVDTGRIYKYTGGLWSIFSGDIKQETLTNKTITQPVISSIYNGGVVTIPSGSRTLVARDTIDTLTNKTLITPIITSIANSGTVTIPTGNRTLVGRDTIDTLSNKTINVNSNTVTATSQALGDILVNNGTQFIRLARGTSGQVLTSDATHVLWSDPSISGSILANTGVYSGLIYKSGSTYYYRDLPSGTLTSNANPDSLFQSALTAGGTIFVQAGTYTFSGSFAGLNFPVNPTRCNFIMDPNAILTVPNGYTGYVFKMMNGASTTACSNNVLMGGLLQEAGTVARNWEGIRLQGTGSSVNGIYHNTIANIQINYPNIGIRLYIDSTGTNAFVNQNYLIRNMIFGAKTAFVNFDMGATYTAGVNGFYRNRFEFNLLQATNGTDATTGFKDIRHKENTFHANYVADFSGSQVTANIHTDAQHTIIDGGTMTSLNFVDSSTTQTTKIRDETYGHKISKITPGNAGTNLDIIPTGTSNTWSWYDSGLTKRLVIQRQSNDTIHFTSIKQTSGGVIQPMIFEVQDVPGSTTTESYRVHTDASIKINKNIQLTKMTAPGNADANTVAVYVDTVDTKLRAKDSLGTTIDMGFAGPVRSKKVGGYTATGATSGWGIFGTMTNVGTAAANQFDNTNGTYAKFSTTTTINSVAGHKYNAFITIRAFNPFLAIKFKNATSATNNILYLGWRGSGTDPTGGTTDPLASNHGIMLVQRSTDTNYQICTNNGGANSTFTSTGVAVDTTTINTFMVRADDTNSKWQWSLNGSAWTDITTTIPAQTTALVYMAEIQTTEAVIHDLWVFGVDVVSDK